jgi:hypothetical protein
MMFQTRFPSSSLIHCVFLKLSIVTSPQPTVIVSWDTHHIYHITRVFNNMFHITVYHCGGRAKS